MRLLLSLLPLLDVIPTVVGVVVLWMLTATVFHHFKGNKARAGLLTLLLLVFAARFGSMDTWAQSVFSYGVLGMFGALTEALYLRIFEKTWDYHEPTILKIPLWLFPLWSLCSMAIVNTYPVLMKVMDQGREVTTSVMEMVAQHKATLHKN